jgi:histidinol dehydrogenase
MIKIYKIGEVSNEEIFARNNPTASVSDIVSGILENVAKNGDAALKEYAQKFDGVVLENLEVTADEIDAAYQKADKTFVAVLEEAAKNIREFHSKQVRQGFQI